MEAAQLDISAGNWNAEMIKHTLVFTGCGTNQPYCSATLLSMDELLALKLRTGELVTSSMAAVSLASSAAVDLSL
jgi:hypothetical protein